MTGMYVMKTCSNMSEMSERFPQVSETERDGQVGRKCTRWHKVTFTLDLSKVVNAIMGWYRGKYFREKYKLPTIC